MLIGLTINAMTKALHSKLRIEIAWTTMIRSAVALAILIIKNAAA